MKLSSKGAIYIGFTGFCFAFIVSLTWLAYIAEYVTEPHFPLAYSIFLMSLGIAMMVTAQRIYPGIVKREKYEAQKAEARQQQKLKEDFEAYWTGIVKQERRIRA